MSELKEHIFCDIDEVFPRGYCGPLPSHEARPYYLKSEADKVIAEFEMKLAAAKLVLRLNEPKALYSNLDTMSRLNHKIDVVERRELHQKYKRCLSMAMLCWAIKELNRYGDQDYMDFAEKWRKRWLKLAEKFKEAK